MLGSLAALLCADTCFAGFAWVKIKLEVERRAVATLVLVYGLPNRRNEASAIGNIFSGNANVTNATHRAAALVAVFKAITVGSAYAAGVAAEAPRASGFGRRFSRYIRSTCLRVRVFAKRARKASISCG